ncbi:DEAD/DEAH box helicase [Sphingobium yanoikuyae]|uniref:DEAD/DEAH box helicase n=1 Tax=Sphingobium TaxID=165695 RepID=UPI0028A61992|nr:DEAD/DEAH box helicase [Sphingobium yanoikuyae]
MFKRLFGRAEQAGFTWSEQGEDLIIKLEHAGKALPFAQWHATRPDVSGAIDAVALNDDEGPDGEAYVEVGDDHLRLSARAVAAIDSATSSALGIPPATPLALDLKAQNRIDQDDFRLVVRWVRPGGHPVRWKMQGAILRTDAGPRRVPEPLFSLFTAAEPLTRAMEKPDRFAALARLREHWPEDPQLPVESEAYLQDLRVHYAASLSLKLKTLTPETTDFDPVLFSAQAVSEAGESGVTLDEEADSILAPAAQKLFASDRFRREGEARPVYVLRNGEYLFIDPALRPALNVVRRLQDAPEEQRRAFVLNPRKALRDVLGDEEADRLGLEQLFIDTEQFSARVAGVDIWRAPVLPWIVPSKKNCWLPEQFGLRIGEDYFAVPADNVPEIVKRVDEAAEAGHPDVDVDGLLKPVDEVGSPPPSRIPVNEQVRRSIASIAPFADAVSTEDSYEAGEIEPAGWNAELNGKLFLVVHDNFEEVDYAPIGLTETLEEEPARPVQSPSRLQATLKTHQVEGLNWLAQCAQVGRPGALLADDMGLGKTLQAIAFMAWLQDEAEAGRRQRAPFLIVAPTGLLGTWRMEIEKHLGEPHLGHLIPAFGSNLKLLREEDSFGSRDIETGKASLNAANWKDAGVVLTTFETLRDYHFSFARTRFGLVIYDEIQKLKNPGSQMTRAAMAINSEFTLGMTGTPVENRLQDLWSIMNVVAPGFLGASRDFEKRHPSDDSDALARLKSQLTDPLKGRPPYMLRRLKSEVLDGMPAKTVHPLEQAMPATQANAYRDLVIRAAAAGAAGNLGKGGMLTTLAQMRGVSLHPLDPRHAPDDLDAYAQDSARLSQTLAILEKVAAAREKALVFVEDLAMQERLTGLIQQRFSLARRPIRINGTIAGHKRQGLVEAFQSRPNSFDVMLLSPRAGGVGLTLTAANHVIHLSRWWNPAVEDQATDRVFRIGQTRDVHVYLPMAVHPDPDLAPSSFDLRLNALIDRKRKLTQDLFFPPDASDGELGDLFREVSLEREIPQVPAEEPVPAEAQDFAQAAEPQSEEPESHGREEALSLESQDNGSDGEQHDDERQDKVAADDEGKETLRPVLSLPKVVGGSQIRMWRRGPGEPRPTQDILELFAGRNIAQVTIRDPYALGTREARSAQIKFLMDLKQTVGSLETVLVEYAPEIEGDLDDMGSRRDFGATFAGTFAGSAPRLTLSRRRKRSYDDDFHDRFVEFDIRHAGGAVKRHELTIGRGLEALYNDRRQCTVTYAPPGSA